MNRLVLLALLGTASIAHAQGMTGTIGSGSLTIGNKLWLHENNNADLNLPLNSPISQQLYFNYAQCVCSQPNASQTSPWYQGSFSLEIDSTPDITQVHHPLEIWVGSNCNDNIQRPMLCHQVMGAGVSDIATIQITNFIKPEVPVYDLMVPEPSMVGCTPRVLSATEWGLADSMGTGTYDFFISDAIQTDSLPPPVPTTFTASGAEGAIQISWSAPTGDVADIAYYQALCADSSGAAGLAHPPAARYVTPRNLCGAAQDATLTPVDVTTDNTGGVDAGSVGLPQGMSQLDPTYLCGEAPTATATSMRIDGLRNGEAYTVIVLAIDKFGNAAGVSFNQTLTPKPVTDFWEDLHARGSDVQGGFCLIAETYGDDHPLTQALRSFRDDTLGKTGFGRWLTDAYYATLGKLGVYVHGHIVLRVISGILLLPLVAFALAWHLFTLPGTLGLILLVVFRRRIAHRLRSRPQIVRRCVVAAVGLALYLAPSAAHAQQPYWENSLGKDSSQETSLADEPAVVAWHVGVKVGPYIPQIDAQLGVSPGPYQQMFGKGSSWMPMLDVDRVIWRGFGQVTIGGSLGYMSNSAHAWVMGSDPNDPNRPRSKGDTNGFHLIPTALVAGYRFTWLDDEYGVPIVPYARGGLSYYIWWATAPSGDFSTIDGSNKARGASLGFQGSIGVAIRAERIDEDAARSMRDSGIEHAGFYAEFQAAKVDGFGSSKKLSVGDNTWFAGVDFEF